MFDQGNRGQALEIWREMRVRFPDLCVTSEAGLNLALDLGRYDEAEALLEEGRRRHLSHASFFATGRARVAYRRGELEEAIHRCDALLRKFPDVAEGYHIAAHCLSGLGRHDAADTMLGRGVMKLPEDFNMNVHYAQSAMHRREWPEALRRWQVLQGRFENIAGPLGVAQCLTQLDRIAEAEQVLSEARLHFGVSDRLLSELANLATAKGDLEGAVQCWEDVLRQFPFFASAYTKGAEAMRKIGRRAEADELLLFAVTRFQSDVVVHLEYARSAHRNGDWAAAAERWALVCDRFPGCAEAREQRAESLAATERHDSSPRQ